MHKCSIKQNVTIINKRQTRWQYHGTQNLAGIVMEKHGFSNMFWIQGASLAGFSVSSHWKAVISRLVTRWYDQLCHFQGQPMRFRTCGALTWGRIPFLGFWCASRVSLGSSGSCHYGFMAVRTWKYTYSVVYTCWAFVHSCIFGGKANLNTHAVRWSLKYAHLAAKATSTPVLQVIF